MRCKTEHHDRHPWSYGLNIDRQSKSNVLREIKPNEFTMMQSIGIAKLNQEAEFMSNLPQDHRYTRISENDPLPDISDLSPFKAILIVEDKPSAAWQTSVCEWLINHGCHYILAWGKDCYSWHKRIESIKSIYREYGNVSDRDSTITTWHDDWTLEQVFHYAKFASNHPTVNLSNILLVHLSSDDKESSFIDEFMAVDRF